MDAVVVPDEQGRLPAGVALSDRVILDEDLAGRIAGYNDAVYTEWNARKAADGSEAARLGERERRRRDGTERQTKDPASMTWPELRELLDGEGPDAAKARLEACQGLAEWCNMHDFHLPHPNGPPHPKQSCAKVAKGTEGTAREVCYCGKLFPRALRKPGEEAVAEDPHRRSLLRAWLLWS